MSKVLLADGYGGEIPFEMGVLNQDTRTDEPEPEVQINDGLCEGGDLTSVRQPCPSDMPSPTPTAEPTATPSSSPTATPTPLVTMTQTEDPQSGRLLIDDIKEGMAGSWIVFLILVVALIGGIVTMVLRSRTR